ncbi:MAG: selenocysteine-specific translation elongation factor [Armatimonadetes bacterium]|nr:selenocysteine-specific translation elongation factor [Armatimonadota bacterium]
MNDRMQDNTRHYILGTAGHIDHGKTALIRALTGIDTDRLPEEKQRGLTVDLGFAFLDLPGGSRLGIVDVPGHEKFLKNMLAGVGGYDLALLVVDAKAGIMPQTREHFQILQLMGISSGLTVLTKCDLVDEEWLLLQTEEVASFLKGTFLDGKPIIPVSSVTGAGLSDLREVLDRLVPELPPKKVSLPFRLPIDRVFLRPGIGVIVTGTLYTGVIRKGDRIELQPSALQARARQIQVHGGLVEESFAGQRAALNLSGVEATLLHRGMVAAPPGILRPSRYYYARLSLLPDAPPRVRTGLRVRLNWGTAEVLARLRVLEGSEIPPGGEALVQFQLEEEHIAIAGDRIVARGYSPSGLLGGAVVLEQAMSRFRTSQSGAVRVLLAKEEGKADRILVEVFGRAGGALTLDDLVRETGLPREETADALARLSLEKRVVSVDSLKVWLPYPLWDAMACKVAAMLQKHREASPWRGSWTAQELSRDLPDIPFRLLEALLQSLEKDGAIRQAEGKISIVGHEAVLTERERELLDAVQKEFGASEFSPPALSEVLSRLCPPCLSHKEAEAFLTGIGFLVSVAEGMYFPRSSLDRIAGLLCSEIREKGSITAAGARDLLGTSRKFIIPLLEYLDSRKVTRRVGDKRVLDRGEGAL